MWVESPLQFLCAVEAHHQGLTGGSAVATARRGARMLPETIAECIFRGLPDGLVLTPAALGPDEPRSRRWLLGDAFSGAVHRQLVTRRLSGDAPQEFIVVDDGLATVHLLELLVQPRPCTLQRARAQLPPARRVLGRMAWKSLRAAADRGALTVFTAMPVSADLTAQAAAAGITVRHNDLTWLTSLPAGLAPDAPVVVLGTSLVANGLMHEEVYQRWLEGFATEVGRIAYFPHRAEDPGFLARLQTDPRFDVSTSALPAEFTLRGLRDDQEVWSLPSTAVATLSAVFSSRGVTFRAVPVSDAWWTEKASPEMREHVVSLTEAALAGAAAQRTPQESTAS